MTQPVGLLREQVARELGVRPYRVFMAHETGSLEHDHLTLEDAGIRNADVKLAAVLEEADKWKDLELEEIFGLAVSNGLESQQNVDQQRLRFQKGEVNEVQCRDIYVPRLRAREQQEETAQRRTEALERRREEAAAARRRALEQEVEKEAKMIVAEADGAATATDRLNAKLAEVKGERDRIVAGIQTMRNDTQCELDLVLPALDDAFKALGSLHKRDVQEWRAFKCPPVAIRRLLSAVCIMFEMKPVIICDPDTGRKAEDYWPVGVRMLNGCQFISGLWEYDKDNIPESVIQKLQPLVESEDLSLEVQKKMGRLGHALCHWVHAMYRYHFVAKGIKKVEEIEIRVDAWRTAASVVQTA